jgi:hypothetical protein
MKQLRISHSKMIYHTMARNPFMRMWGGADDLIREFETRVRFINSTEPTCGNEERFWATLELCRQMVIEYHEMRRYWTIYFQFLRLLPGESQHLEDWVKFHTLIGELPDSENRLMLLDLYSGLTEVEFSEILGLTEDDYRELYHSAQRRIQELRTGMNNSESGQTGKGGFLSLGHLRSVCKKVIGFILPFMSE